MLPKLPKTMLRDEEEMRTFYRTVGMRPERIELAIKVARDRATSSGDQELKSRKARKGRPPASSR
jgi:hypothetical protein